MTKKLPRMFALLLIAAGPTAHASVFDGSWKADLDQNKQNAKPDVRVLANGVYKCLSCDPPNETKADGSDQPFASQGLDTRSVRVIDDHSVQIVGKKKGKKAFELAMSTSDGGKSEKLRETIYDMGAKPFTVTEYFTRVAPGPAGSHAVSGTWRLVKTEGSDDVDVTTFKLVGNTMTRRDAQGSSYVAKLDGTPAPYVGDPRWDHVSIKMPNPNTLEETLTKDGALRMRARWVIDADGKTAHARFTDAKGNVFEQSGHKMRNSRP